MKRWPVGTEVIVIDQEPPVRGTLVARGGDEGPVAPMHQFWHLDETDREAERSRFRLMGERAFP